MEIIEIQKNKIEYELQRKRIKNCYISVKNGKVVVRVPLKMSPERVNEILEKRANWILENVKKQQKVLPKRYVEGEVFAVLGKAYELKIFYEKNAKPKVKWMVNQLVVILPEEKEHSEELIKGLMDDFYRKIAETEIEKAMRKMSMKVGIAPNSYKIKNLKSTWGNCSTSGNISISQKLAQYSKHAIEYVCLHEICHLRYMNHSRDFWSMVEKFMPDYKLAEQELKN